MPISAGTSMLKTQIKNALSMDKGANIKTTGQIIASAVASVVSMGIFPTSPSPVPLMPVGLSAGVSMMKNAFNMDKGATIDTTSQMIASAIQMITPTVPPKGLSALKTEIKNALSMDKGANINTTSAQFASAIINYYLSGGVK